MGRHSGSLPDPHPVDVDRLLRGIRKLALGRFKCLYDVPGELTPICHEMQTFVISRATPYMFSSWKNYVFLFFGLGSAVGFVFVWFFVPETKGIPIEKMDEIFGKQSRAFLAALQHMYFADTAWNCRD